MNLKEIKKIIEDRTMVPWLLYESSIYFNAWIIEPQVDDKENEKYVEEGIKILKKLNIRCKKHLLSEDLLGRRYGILIFLE